MAQTEHLFSLARERERGSESRALGLGTKKEAVAANAMVSHGVGLSLRSSKIESLAGPRVRLFCCPRLCHIEARTAAENRLLTELSVHAGWVVTHEDLLNRVWGPIDPCAPGVISTHLMRLRQKLRVGRGEPTYIFSEPNVGRRMVEGETNENRAKHRG